MVFFWVQPIRDKERILLQGFVKKNLKKDCYSFPLDVEHRLVLSNRTTGSDNVYGTIWKNNGNTIYSGLFYNYDNSQISSYAIYITLGEPLGNIDKTKASSISKIYFNTFEEDWTCGSLIADNPETSTLCESFWVDGDSSKRGVGIIGSDTQTTLYICEFPRGSERYDQESCIDIHIK